MKLQIHSIHFDADTKLLDYIQKKADKLDQYFDRIVDGEVFLRLNNSGVTNKTVEIKLNMPGTQLFSKERSCTFEQAVDEAIDNMRRQVKKHKEKLESH